MALPRAYWVGQCLGMRGVFIEVPILLGLHANGADHDASRNTLMTDINMRADKAVRRRIGNPHAKQMDHHGTPILCASCLTRTLARTVATARHNDTHKCFSFITHSLLQAVAYHHPPPWLLPTSPTLACLQSFRSPWPRTVKRMSRYGAACVRREVLHHPPL